MERERSKPEELDPSETGGTVSGRDRAPKTLAGVSMVFEEDMRKASGKRTLEFEEQRQWVAFRRGLPINQWAERPGRELGRQEIARMKQALERYLVLFRDEAAERGFSLGMETNYYSQALELLAACRRRKSFSHEDRERLRGLMILVDWKDAVLGLQILQSVV